jgi:hypothetical protein
LEANASGPAIATNIIASDEALSRRTSDFDFPFSVIAFTA